jgi:hypothetical protein
MVRDDLLLLTVLADQTGTRDRKKKTAQHEFSYCAALLCDFRPLRS